MCSLKLTTKSISSPKKQLKPSSTSILVNLRCASILEKQVHLVNLLIKSKWLTDT